MVLLIVLVFVLAYVFAASWAAHTGGQRRLWGAGGIALSVVVILAWLAGHYYRVPSTGRVMLYACTLFAPSVVLANVLLSGGRASPVATLTRATVGASVGLLCGFLLVVFGLGVW